MNERLQRLLDGDDRGYGVVLGAMVMLGMALVAFSTYQTALAPDLQARSESQQSADAADQLVRWVGSAGQARVGSSGGPPSATIPLGSESPPFAAQPSSSTLSFDPDQRPARIDAGNLSIERLNGTLVGGTDETWESTDNASLASIVDVSRFRLRVDEIDSSHTGESVTVNVSNATGSHAGDLRLSVDPTGDSSSQGYELVVRTRDAGGAVLYEQPILISSTTHDSHSDPISPYWVNLLNDDYQFDRVLAAAQPPFDVSLDENGLTSDYTIAYARQGTEGSSGTTGLVVEDYNVTRPSGVLAFDAQAAQAPDQTLTVEHGAVIRSQGDGTVFAREPLFSSTLKDHVVKVVFTWPSLTGSPDAVASGSSVGLHGTAVDTYQVEGQATNLTVNLTTEQPELYRTLFEDELEDVGLSQGRGFSTAHGSDWVRVDVWGLTDPDPGSDAYDVGVHLRSVQTEVQIGG